MLTVLCPGQGAQKIGMGKSLAATCNKAKDIFDMADAILGKIDGFFLSEYCFAGPEEMLRRTDISQPAIFVTSLASIMSYKNQNGSFIVKSAAGLSLGEYTALVLAEVFTFEEGLRLVARRGQLMQQAAKENDGTMLACMGEERQVFELLKEIKLEVGAGVVLDIANYNSTNQFVLSGDTIACEKAEILAEKFNIKAKLLSVSGAFHSSHMSSAAEGLEDFLEHISIGIPKIEVWSNVTARPHESDPKAIKKRLVEQLTMPVRWTELISEMHKMCSRRYYELPPAGVLRGLMRRIDRTAKVDVLND